MSPLEWWPPLTLDHDQGRQALEARRATEGPLVSSLDGGGGVSLECGPSMDRNLDPWLSQSDRDCQETNVSNLFHAGPQGLMVMITCTTGLPSI